MSGAAIIIVFFVLRVLVGTIGVGGLGSQEPRDRIERDFGFLLLWVLLGPAWLASWVGGIVDLNPWLLGTALALTPVMLPWALCRRITMPLGLVRMTYWIARLSMYVLGRDRYGGPLLAATVAFRQRPQSERTRAWLRGRYEKLKELRGGSATGWAVLLDEDDDDREMGQSRMEAAAWFDWRVSPAVGRRMVGEWLACRAIEQQHWRAALAVARRRESKLFWAGPKVLQKLGVSVSELAQAASRGTLDVVLAATGSRPAFGGSPALEVTEAVAQRALRDAHPPAGVSLRLALLRCAHREQWQAVLDEVSASTEKRAQAPAPTGDALADAVTTHLFVKSRPVTSAVELHRFGRAWEDVLYRDDTRAALVGRARALGVNNPEQVFERIEGEVTDAIAALVGEVDMGRDIAEPSTLVTMAAEEVRDQRVEALELCVGQIAGRVAANRRLPTVDEFEEFAVMLHLYDRVARSAADGRELAYSQIGSQLTDWACWLWNDRQQYSLANAIFRFCAVEGLRTNHIELARINLDNIGCRGG